MPRHTQHSRHERRAHDALLKRANPREANGLRADAA
jgi:hypothetical protein